MKLQSVEIALSKNPRIILRRIDGHEAEIRETDFITSGAVVKLAGTKVSAATVKKLAKADRDAQVNSVQMANGKTADEIKAKVAELKKPTNLTKLETKHRAILKAKKQKELGADKFKKFMADVEAYCNTLTKEI